MSRQAFCVHCGERLADSVRFCGACGADRATTAQGRGSDYTDPDAHAKPAAAASTFGQPPQPRPVFTNEQPQPLPQARAHRPPIKFTGRMVGAAVGVVVAVLLAGVLVLVLLSRSGPARANKVTGNLPVGANPTGVAVDSSTQTAYVTNGDGGTVSVIKNGAATSTIRVGNNPTAIAVNPSTHTAYVSSGGSTSVTQGGCVNCYSSTVGAGTVSVIDTQTNAVTGTIGVGVNPTGVAVDESARTLYVTNGGGDPRENSTVSVIDTGTNAVTATVTVGSTPAGIAVDTKTHTAYVTNNGSRTVSVVGGTRHSVAATIRVGAGPIGVAVDESTHTAYVTNEDDNAGYTGGNTVSVIDTQTNTVTDTITVGAVPLAAAVDESTHTAYVTSYGGTYSRGVSAANTADPSVSMIDTHTNKLIGNPIAIGSSPDGVTVDVKAHTVYATAHGNGSSGTVVIIQ